MQGVIKITILKNINYPHEIYEIKIFNIKFVFILVVIKLYYTQFYTIICIVEFS